MLCPSLLAQAHVPLVLLAVPLLLLLAGGLLRGARRLPLGLLFGAERLLLEYVAVVAVPRERVVDDGVAPYRGAGAGVAGVGEVAPLHLDGGVFTEALQADALAAVADLLEHGGHVGDGVGFLVVDLAAAQLRREVGFGLLGLAFAGAGDPLEERGCGVPGELVAFAVFAEFLEGAEAGGGGAGWEGY